MKWFFVVFLFLCSLNAQSQSRKEFEAQRIRIQQEIKQASELLSQTQSTQKDILQESDDLAQKIARQQELIQILKSEIRGLDRDIDQKRKEVEKQEKELEDLKTQYADLIYQSYKSKSKNARLLFVLSSESFVQAFKRLEYMTQYTEFRQEQAVLIGLKKEKLDSTVVQLEKSQSEQKVLLGISQTEAASLKSDQVELEKLAVEVQKKEKFYRKQIQSKQKQEAEIDEQIKELIRKAIAASKAKANAKKKSAKKFNGFALSPEAVALQKNFEQNKGKLPWPVKSGVITRRFGTQNHPTLKGIKIKSNGIRIQTEKGSQATAVFSGSILAIQVQSNGTKNVLIQHGNYITIYKNLYNLNVKKGQEIKTGSNLGTVFTDQVSGKTTLGFVLMKQVTPQNPQLWILSR
ncbi:MAG: murein hydrolase activator EnvC family protein [Flavobacteriaceae bacterium]